LKKAKQARKRKKPEDLQTLEEVIYKDSKNPDKGFKLSDDYELQFGDGTSITIGELAERLGKEPKDARGKSNRRKPVEFYKYFLRLMYDPDLPHFANKTDLNDIFNIWNKKVGKIKERDIEERHIRYETQVGRRGPKPGGGRWRPQTGVEPGKLIQLTEGTKDGEVEVIIKYIRDVYPKASVNKSPIGIGRIIPNFRVSKKQKEKLFASFSEDKVFDRWINNELEEDPYKLVVNRLENAKNNVKEYMDSFYPNGFPGEVTTSKRFSDQWFKDNKNKSFPFLIFRQGHIFNRKKEKINFLGLVQKKKVV
ncbi:uncharacterized protein METZ01_LOCUS367204, partial [marine metagenome]